MFPKLIKWLFGDAAASSVGGILVGALTGAATVAATGNMDKDALMVAAISGAASALAGVGGRAMGENKQ